MKAARPEKKLNRRARAAGPEDHLLNVRMRVATARRRRRERIGRWVANLLVAVAFAAAGFFGLRAAADRFFFENPNYTLRRITFELDGLMTREEALAETALQEGMNIFSLDLARIESALKAIPQVESVRINRELPDHLAIRLTARHPVAWVAALGETGDPSAGDNPLLVDASGFLMQPRRIFPEYYHLPAIYGVQSDNIRAGEMLPGEDLRRALDLLAALKRHPESLLRIRALDISRGYCIEVISDHNARIRFAAQDFDEQIARLQALLAHCEEFGKTLETADLMVKRNTPVRFAAAASQAEESAPGSPAGASAATRRN